MGNLKKTMHALVILLSVGCARPYITIHYDVNAQVELISSKGTRVVIDLVSLDRLTSPMTESDILVVTHDHIDHFEKAFIPTFKGKKMLMTEGELTVQDVHILGIKSETMVTYISAGHKKPAGYRTMLDNYIYIIEMDGVRIVHFGDINQLEFTADQIAKIGKVDVAIMPFDWPLHELNVQNKVSFQLMQQLLPSMIIPTHFSIEAAEYARTLWPCFYTDKKTIHVKKGIRNHSKTSLLMMGYSNSSYAETIHATAWRD